MAIVALPHSRTVKSSSQAECPCAQGYKNIQDKLHGRDVESASKIPSHSDSVCIETTLELLVKDFYTNISLLFYLLELVDIFQKKLYKPYGIPQIQ